MSKFLSGFLDGIATGAGIVLGAFLAVLVIYGVGR